MNAIAVEPPHGIVVGRQAGEDAAFLGLRYAELPTRSSGEPRTRVYGPEGEPGADVEGAIVAA